MTPFVKTAGGKSKLSAEIAARVPRFARYFEPFVGGGAAFLAVRDVVLRRASESGGTTENIASLSSWAHLNDANRDLVNVYVQLRHRAPDLADRLLAIQHSREFYYMTRAREPTDPFERAVRYVYLNKTCFNGLHRVNTSGHFNVPMGSYKNPTIAVRENLLDWQHVLKNVNLSSEDFEQTLSRTGDGDFVYCDPPYLPRSKTADFTAYTAGSFTLEYHKRLAHALRRASDRGAMILCSQGDSAAIRDLYSGFRIEEISVHHSIGASSASKHKVAELLLSNYVIT